MFGAVLGKALDERSLPATSRLFARLRETEDAVVGPAKKAFKRVRPYVSSTEVKALVRPSISGAYPSGHTTNATLAAIVMGDIPPLSSFAPGVLGPRGPFCIPLSTSSKPMIVSSA